MSKLAKRYTEEFKNTIVELYNSGKPCIKDLNSRKIVGYSMFKNIDTKLAIKALENAYKFQKPNEI